MMHARRFLILTVLIIVVACSSDQLLITGPESRSATATVGQMIGVDLSNIGPGTYASPPAVSASSVEFVDVAIVGPNNPGGPTQRFRFYARSVGTAVVRFERPLLAGGFTVVEDTIVVRR